VFDFVPCIIYYSTSVVLKFFAKRHKMYTERGTISVDFVYNLMFRTSLALSQFDLIKNTLQLQQLSYRLMEGGATMMCGKCI